jgi:hypothetical protein
MSQVCNETGETLCGPFRVMSAVKRNQETGELAESDLEVCLSYGTALKVFWNLVPSPEKIQEDIFYKIEGAEGFVGGRTRTVQSCRGYSKYGDVMYFSARTASKRLPKSAKMLLSNPNWVELSDGVYKPAEWARKLD